MYVCIYVNIYEYLQMYTLMFTYIIYTHTHTCQVTVRLWHISLSSLVLSVSVAPLWRRRTVVFICTDISWAGPTSCWQKFHVNLIYLCWFAPADFLLTWWQRVTGDVVVRLTVRVSTRLKSRVVGVVFLTTDKPNDSELLHFTFSLHLLWRMRTEPLCMIGTSCVWPSRDLLHCLWCNYLQGVTD